MIKKVYLKFLIRFVIPDEILESLSLNFVNCVSKGMRNEDEYHRCIQQSLKVACQWLSTAQKSGWKPVIMGMADEHNRDRS
ncbi:hypothetical protein [Planctomycetes bacterium K23_9]|uniref:Uncharacterized protein n=1 Tax=Stieleria marina TaxID=1930275 RepID=A0A517P279_9BACT|nr:hypothetical protein K239x_55020 [Planctomycetes bacterium K23_9]